MNKPTPAQIAELCVQTGGEISRALAFHYDMRGRHLLLTKDVLQRISSLGTDCAAMDDPASFYRSQLHKAIGAATVMLEALPNEL